MSSKKRECILIVYKYKFSLLSFSKMNLNDSNILNQGVWLIWEFVTTIIIISFYANFRVFVLYLQNNYFIWNKNDF